MLITGAILETDGRRRRLGNNRMYVRSVVGAYFPAPTTAQSNCHQPQQQQQQQLWAV